MEVVTTVLIVFLVMAFIFVGLFSTIYFYLKRKKSENQLQQWYENERFN